MARWCGGAARQMVKMLHKDREARHEPKEWSRKCRAIEEAKMRGSAKWETDRR